MPGALMLGNCDKAFLYSIMVNEESRTSVCLSFSL